MDRWRAITGRAAEVVRQYEREVERGAFGEGYSAAVDIEEIAWRCFELEVIDDPNLEEGVLGELDLDRGTISVRTGLELSRRAFTVAHEIGHAALGHSPRIPGFERRVLDPDDSIDERVGLDKLEVQDGIYQAYNARDLMEIEANLFAAEVLAPTELLLAAMRDDPDWTANGLSRRFGVSETAMLTQLSNALLLQRGAEVGDIVSNGLEEDVQETAGIGTLAPGLDTRQREAVVAKTPALVIAGPGAGKTRVLAERYACLVRSGVPVDSILAVTFSNKAAEEMRRRVTGMLDGLYDGDVRVFTFHAFCLDVLKSYGHWVGLPEGFDLATEMDTSLIVRGKLCELELSHLENLSDPGLYVPAILDAVSRAKDELRDPEEFEELAEEWVKAAEDTKEREEAEKTLEAAKVYAAYEGWLADDGRVDYGDLIRLTIRVLQLPGVGDEIRGRYEHVLVDEFQDINFASGRLLKALDGDRGIVWAVADPDQSIYGFRGASAANLDRFGDDYPGFRLIRLDRNYRSGPDIVGACQGLRGVLAAAGEEDGVPPLLEATRPAPGMAAVSLAVAPDREAELDYLIEQIRGRAGRGISLGDQAVLCTSNAQARRVVDRLTAAGIAAQGPASLLGGEEIKDALAVLALLRGGGASNAALLRVAGFDDNPLSEAEALRLLEWAREQELTVREAMDRCAEIEGLAEPSVEYVTGLYQLLGELPSWGDAWYAVLAYAFHPNGRLRGLFFDSSDDAGRRLSQVGQLAVLARSFTDREDLVEGDGLRGFIEYVGEAASSKKGDGVLYASPVEEAVQVMTVHKSKGLEFPVVYVPHLAKGHFPVRGGGAEIKRPPGLSHDESKDNEEEERCLFYVALTRAEDELVLSRAEAYGKQKPGALPLIDRLVREKGGRAMVVESRWEPDTGPMTGPIPSELMPPGPAQLEDDALSIWLLESYDRCPLRAGYALLPGMSNRRVAYQDFRDSVYRVLGDMQVRARESGENPDLGWARARLAEVWEKEGPTGHFYERAYRRRAEQIVEMWQATRGPIGWNVREGMAFSTAEGTRLEATADAIKYVGGKIVVARHRFGRPRKSHKEGIYAYRHALYVAAARQTWPGTPVEVVLHYLPSGESVEATPSERVISGRMDKLTGYAKSISEGSFSPKPGMECMRCPYNLVCPSSA